MTQPYFDTDRDIDVALHTTRQVGVCAMCGAAGPVFEGAVELAIAGGYVYELGLRCCETAECRKRRQGVKSSPPIPREPENYLTPAAEPVQADPPMPPDEEAPVEPYF
jgi:hypothetical protein